MEKVDINTKLHLLDSGGFTRKPVSWREVGSPILGEWLDELEQYKSSDLGIERNLGARFTKQPYDTVFLVAHNGGLYLVNTEGGDYARYVRYAGNITACQRDVVTVDKGDTDQPIEITQINGRFVWTFVNWPEDEMGEYPIAGPFDTRAEAVENAEEYCTSGPMMG